VVTTKIHGKGLIITSGNLRDIGKNADQKLESGLVQAIHDPNQTKEELAETINALRRDPVIPVKPR